MGFHDRDDFARHGGTLVAISHQHLPEGITERRGERVCRSECRALCHALIPPKTADIRDSYPHQNDRKSRILENFFQSFFAMAISEWQPHPKRTS
ncbi:MAG TPA: hypothetical protein VIJ11_08295, partial [Galbitalea sp.]